MLVTGQWCPSDSLGGSELGIEVLDHRLGQGQPPGVMRLTVIRTIRPLLLLFLRIRSCPMQVALEPDLPRRRAPGGPDSPQATRRPSTVAARAWHRRTRRRMP